MTSNAPKPQPADTAGPIPNADEIPWPAIPVLTYGRVRTSSLRRLIDEQNREGRWALGFATVAAALLSSTVWDFHAIFPFSCLFLFLALPSTGIAGALSVAAIVSRRGRRHAGWLALAVLLVDGFILYLLFYRL